MSAPSSQEDRHTYIPSKQPGNGQQTIVICKVQLHRLRCLSLLTRLQLRAVPAQRRPYEERGYQLAGYHPKERRKDIYQTVWTEGLKMFAINWTTKSESKRVKFKKENQLEGSRIRHEKFMH